MASEAGELLVGAFLHVCRDCELLQYNVHLAQPGLAGMGEIDVVALNLANSTAYVCEVATHLDGLNYGNGNADTTARLNKKLAAGQAFAQRCLGTFKSIEFMLWAPYVPTGALLTELRAIPGLTLVVNGDYAARMNELRAKAGSSTKQHGNVAFRVLQVLEHLRP